MKVKIPSRIHIGSHCVTIKYEKGLSDNHGKRGQARHLKCEIVIAPEATNSVKTEALIHELVHFLDDIYNNYRLEEYETDALANGIAILLKDLGIELDWACISENVDK